MEVQPVGTPANQVFYSGAVPITVGVLNPTNSAQTVWDVGTAYLYASITTVVTGAPTSFTILLEGSLDGVAWFTLATASNVAGETQFSPGTVPFAVLRARCTAVSGGTAPTVAAAVVAYQGAPAAITGGAAPGSAAGAPFTPSGANILNGFAVRSNTVASLAFLTVPAGRTWFGCVNVVCSNDGAIGANDTAQVLTGGTGVIPTSGNIIAAAIDSGAAGTSGQPGYAGAVYVQAPAGNAVNLLLLNSTATTFSSLATANGVLL